MTPSDMGERDIIRLLAREFAAATPSNQNHSSDSFPVAVGIGDDCAALSFGDSYLLLTTDMLVGATDVPKGMTPFQIGWHAVAINFSDIAAKGGTPLYFLLSMALPTADENFLKELAKGINVCASRYNARVIGGDTNEADDVILSGTALGIVAKKHFMSRVGAREGDVVAVTGELGSAAAGFQCVKNNYRRAGAIEALFQPTPRVDEGIALSKTLSVTSAMDISDGLASSLHQLAEANDVGFDIEWRSLPLSEETKKISEKTGVPLEELALFFGGDYELLVTVASEKFARAKRAVELLGEGNTLTAIGRVANAKNGITLAYANKKRKKIANRGYEHFIRRKKM
jgi:thiamine-monophosphate kinase